MSLSQSPDHQGGSSAPALDPPPSSPENPSFTSFPEGEGATNPDIPQEPMLNKFYNKVLSLTSSGKSPAPSNTTSEHGPLDAIPRSQEVATGLGISLNTSHQSKSPSVTSFGAAEMSSITSIPPVETAESVSSRQNTTRAEKASAAVPAVLEPVVAQVHAIGGFTRSEEEFSNHGSDKAPTEASKHTSKSHLREINLPGLAGFRLTREPSSDSESVSSYSVNTGRTVKSIIGRLKTGDLGREFWMKDESSHECFRCGEKFTSKLLVSRTKSSVSSETSLSDMWTNFRRQVYFPYSWVTIWSPRENSSMSFLQKHHGRL
jgi:hypothetical protein